MLLILLQVVADTAAAVPSASRHRIGLGSIAVIIVAVVLVGARMRHRRRAHLKSMETPPKSEER